MNSITMDFRIGAKMNPEVEYLHRLELLEPDEIEAIKARALALVDYNRGRDPSDPTTNFIPDHDGFIEFCMKQGLLTADDGSNDD